MRLNSPHICVIQSFKKYLFQISSMIRRLEFAEFKQFGICT